MTFENMSVAEKVFRTIEWITFVGLCLLSIIFIWQVIDQFNSKDSSFKVQYEPIKQHPTITFCFQRYMPNGTGYTSELKYGQDFKMKFDNDESYFKEGVNYRQKTSETFFLEKLSTWLSGTCYKLNTTLSIITKGEFRNLNFEFFKEFVEYERIPEMIVYFTSEVNAYGITANVWIDGEPLTFKLKKNSELEVSLKQVKYIHLESKAKCRVEPFYEVYERLLLKTCFSKCPNRCTTTSLASGTNEIPLCLKKEENICARKVQSEVWHLLANSEEYSKACSTIDYTGRIIYENQEEKDYNIKKYNKNIYTMELEYVFSSPEVVTVNEEYLIYDLMSMIGSIGGSLGLCIGFSFSGLISSIISIIQQCLRFYSSVKCH